MKKNALKNNQQLKQVLFDIQTAECEVYAENTEPVAFSPAFEQKMEQLLRSPRRFYDPLINRNYKKVLLGFVAALILLVTTVFSISALRGPVVHFFVEVYEKFSHLVFSQEASEEPFPATLETYYAPAWIPEGYQLDSTNSMDSMLFRSLIYTSNDNTEILFKQRTISSNILIDTEGMQTWPLTIQGYDGLYYTNKDMGNLIWNNELYGFSLSGPVDQMTLLRIAESVQAEK